MALLSRAVRRLSSISGSSSSTLPLLWEPQTEHTAATTSTVQILSWGRGSSGQLGGGKEEIRQYPSPVASLILPSNFRLAPTQGRLHNDEINARGGMEVGLSCGLFHSSVLVDGSVWVWGKGDGGRLGLGNEDPSFVPVQNPNLKGVRSIALGGVHSAALTGEGEVYTWGYGGFGALGHSVYHRELLPRSVAGGWEKISHIATSGAHTAAVSDTGQLYTWGRDEGDGRLGLGSGGGPGEGGSFAVPSKVNALPVPVKAVACGGFFTLALTPEGEVWSWGANSNYELGRGNSISDWQPQPVVGLENVRVIQIASGGYHSLALSDSGKVFSWGHGGHGQLGHHSLKNEEVPLPINALSTEKVIHITCGGTSSAAVTDKGKLYMWGNARDCQLGVPGLPDIQPSPVKVQFLVEDDKLGDYHVLSVAIGASHAICLVLRQGTQ